MHTLQQLLATVGVGAVAYVLVIQVGRINGRITIFGRSYYDVIFACGCALIAQYFFIR